MFHIKNDAFGKAKFGVVGDVKAYEKALKTFYGAEMRMTDRNKPK